MDVINYNPLGGVYVNDALIGSMGTLDDDMQSFKYTPSDAEITHCTNVYSDALPKGRLWEAYGVEGTPNNAIAQGVGAMIAVVLAYFEYVRKETCPYTTTDLIEEWEESVGLPDPCTIQHFQTIEERRQQVILRLRKTPIVTAAQMETMVKTLTGFDVKVVPRRSKTNYQNALFDGLSNFDAPEFSNDLTDRFTFDVFVDYTEESGLDGSLDFGALALLDGLVRPDVIKCVIERLKPANSVAVYQFSSELYTRAKNGV